MFDKYVSTEVRNVVIQHLDSVIYPKLEQIVLRRLNEIVDTRISEVATKAFQDKNAELAEVLTKVIVLLAIPDFNKK